MPLRGRPVADVHRGALLHLRGAVSGKAHPLARRLPPVRARRRTIHPHRLHGSAFRRNDHRDPDGVRPEDVRNHVATPATAANAPATAAPAAASGLSNEVAPLPLPSASLQGGREVNEIPFRGVRRKTAEAMVKSKFTATHFSLIEEVDCTAMKQARTIAKPHAERYGLKMTYMPYIMKATAIALMEYPQLNAELDEDAGVIREKKYVNLGIAVDTPNGLMVPAVNDCHIKGLLQLSSDLFEVASRARLGKVTAADFADTTFTISNAGNIGGIMATPIIN